MRREGETERDRDRECACARERERQRERESAGVCDKTKDVHALAPLATTPHTEKRGESGKANEMRNKKKFNHLLMRSDKKIEKRSHT